MTFAPLGWQVTGVAMSLFLSTCFHADVVVSLARSLGLGLYARFSEITAVFCTAVRSSRLCGIQRARSAKHHEQNDDDSHVVTSFLVFARRVLARHARGLVECSAYALGELEGIIVRPKVHEEQAWLFGEHVAV
jgi:hypothetical protein